VWNRSREKAERVAPFGATVHDRASGAVQAADVVVTMLENGPVGHDVLFGSAGRARHAARHPGDHRPAHREAETAKAHRG